MDRMGKDSKQPDADYRANHDQDVSIHMFHATWNISILWGSFFSPRKLGKIWKFNEHIFQMGWNHQPVHVIFFVCFELHQLETCFFHFFTGREKTNKQPFVT